MGLLARMPAYDRSRLLDAAARAATRRRHERAIQLYRTVLAAEPENGEIHARIAPLLARTGRRFDAWLSFRCAARAQLCVGRVDLALAAYRLATQHLPRELAVWEAMADLMRERGRSSEVTGVLLEARRRFRRRSLRPQAIHLLRRVHEIDPWHFAAVFDLAHLLACTGQREEALRFLDGLGARSRGRELRRVRAAELRWSPGFRRAWRWLRVALQRGGGGPMADSSDSRLRAPWMNARPTR